MISGDGAILTALHVVEYADEILVTLSTAPRPKLRLRPSCRTTTLRRASAGHAARRPSLPATLGNPGVRCVGDEAFVVGNPLGLTGSIASGVISGFD
ncbi:MAG: hypothetical protein R2838_25805 [Caldilineaceae bacterium]